MATLVTQAPYKPKKHLLKTILGKNNVVQKASMKSRFTKLKWIHYDKTAGQAGKLKVNSKDMAFLLKGFTNQKNTTEGFQRHKLSKRHQRTIQVMIIVPRTVHDIGKSLSTAHARNKAETADCC